MSSTTLIWSQLTRKNGSSSNFPEFQNSGFRIPHWMSNQPIGTKPHRNGCIQRNMGNDRHPPTLWNIPEFRNSGWIPADYPPPLSDISGIGRQPVRLKHQLLISKGDLIEMEAVADCIRAVIRPESTHAKRLKSISTLDYYASSWICWWLTPLECW